MYVIFPSLNFKTSCFAYWGGYQVTVSILLLYLRLFSSLSHFQPILVRRFSPFYLRVSYFTVSRRCCLLEFYPYKASVCPSCSHKYKIYLEFSSIEQDCLPDSGSSTYYYIATNWHVGTKLEKNSNSTYKVNRSAPYISLLISLTKNIIVTKALIKTLGNLEAGRLNYFHAVKCSKLLGSLSTNDSNGWENVHLKLNLHCFKFHLFQNVKCWQTTFLGLNSKGFLRNGQQLWV